MNTQEKLIARIRHWIAKFDALPIMTSDAQKMRQDYIDAIAEIQRQDRHLERLGSWKTFTPCFRNGDYESEYIAHVEYARTHRFEGEE